ncbi:hypothetical protein WJX81_006025 [Elliptochloris bilobata]|uniref:histone acetyltransferase n=1 Tax=Elliptochloris bilobata TaxID=381761 RepID=A0AAW1RP40_9CHLO
MAAAARPSRAAQAGAADHRQPEGEAAAFEVGSRVLVDASWDDKQKYLAEVVDRRRAADGSSSYYVHYHDMDKRMDEWRHELDLVPYQGAALADVATPRAALLPTMSGASLTSELITRNMKKKYNEIYHVPTDITDLAPIDQTLEKEHHERTKVKNIQVIELGRYEVDTWYYSPYPEPYNGLDRLFLCEFCLKYFGKRSTLLRHAAKCALRHPPGDEIYRSPPAGPGSVAPAIAMFEVDGNRSKIYCQCLCLMAKLFLDHKTLYYDVVDFLFYVLCEVDNEGYHIVGYFSKEKASQGGNNLACILTLPPYQRKGYGRFLIAFSYELTKKEGGFGTPERPLSDLGNVSYKSYWIRAILEVLHAGRGSMMSIQDVSNVTGIHPADVREAMGTLQLTQYVKGDTVLNVTPRIVEEHLQKMDNRLTILIDPARLHWTPYVASPTAGRR